jgi:hypothetical protein
MTTHAARAIFLEAKRRCDADVHISNVAIFRLGQAMDAYGLALAARALAVLEEDNEKRRRLLRIPERRRLTDDDVEVALEGDG